VFAPVVLRGAFPSLLNTLNFCVEVMFEDWED
jgi:hypothetical protein